MYCRYILGAIKLINFFFLKRRYTSTFESASIGLLYFIHSRPIVPKRWYRLYSHFRKACPGTSKNAGIGSKKQKRWYRSGDPIMTFKPRWFEALGKKNAGIGILTLS